MGRNERRSFDRTPYPTKRFENEDRIECRARRAHLRGVAPRGSPRKLTAQFALRDFAVFKVMFVAVIVAAALLWLADAIGWMPATGIYVPTLFFRAVAAGGALIGAGFAIGGYCPGTSAVGFASGRLDALIFMLGMVVGIGLFAGLFDDIEPFYLATEGAKGQTLEGLLGLPSIAIIAALAVMAVAGYRVGSALERRRGGPLSAVEVVRSDGGD